MQNRLKSQLPILIGNKLPTGFIVTLSTPSEKASHFILTIWSHTLGQHQFLPFWKKTKKPNLPKPVEFEVTSISSSYHLYTLILEDLQEKLGCKLKIGRELGMSCDFVVL